MQRETPPPLLPLLRSAAQARLLAAVLADPETERPVKELAEIAGTSLSTATREVQRAEQAGLVRSRTVGTAKLVRADTSSPAYRPLAELLLVTFGPVAVVAEEFGGLAGVSEVHLFGSWAARYAGHAGPPPRDVDVLVVGEVDRDALFAAAAAAERRLGQPIDVTVRSREAWRRATDPFVAFVRERPLVQVVPPTRPAEARATAAASAASAASGAA